MAPHGPPPFLQRWQSSRSFSALSALVWTLLACSLLAAPLPTNNTKPDSYPAWWFEREVIKQTTEPPVAEPVWPGNYPDADDYTAVNLGQLKHVATQAAAEMSAHLPGGTSPAIDALVAQWAAPPANGVTRDDFTALNLGQLKAVAALFYDRLIAVRYIRAYPWAAGSADDFAVANLGQLKYLFSFDLTYSTMHDGVPDWWKLAAGLKVTAPVLTIFTGNNTLLINGQPITYAIAYSQGYDPTTAATSDPENNPVPGQGSPLTELGTVNYVAIDVSSAHTQDPVYAVAIDGDGKIGFLHYVLDADGFSVGTKSATFSNGTVTAAQNMSPYSRYDPVQDRTHLAGSGGNSVNASGDIGGLAFFANEDLGWAMINNDEKYPPASTTGGIGTGTATPGNTVFGSINLGNSGLAMGTFNSLDLDFPGKHYAFVIDGPEENWYDAATISFGPYLYSPSGIGTGGYDSATGPDTYGVGDYSTSYSIDRLSPLAISDDYLVVGDDESAEDDKDALSVHDGHVIRRLSSLLPDEYCNKIRFPRHKDDFTPEAWINTDGDIVVTAEVLDDHNPGSPKWVPRMLLWRNALNPDDDEINPKTLSFASFPAAAYRNQFNAAATFVGIQYVANTDANGTPAPAGGTHAAAVVIPPVEIQIPKLDKNGKMETSKEVTARALKVAKLVPVMDSEGGVHYPLHPVGTVPPGQLLDPSHDPDCFYIVIHDAAKRGKSPRLRITTECAEAGFEGYSDSASTDDANVVEMEDFGDTGDKLRTKAMILVSDDTDDRYPIDGVADNALNDRSRRIALGGKVHVDLLDWAKPGQVPPRISIEVKKEKTVSVHAVIMSDAGDVIPAAVAEDIRRANERYAQVGLRVVLDGPPVIKAPPVGGSRVLAADLFLGSQAIAVGRQARPSTNPPSDNPPITVIYCQDITGTMVTAGFGIARFKFPANQDLWNLIYLGPYKKTFTFAHELGHILTNIGHWGDPGYRGSVIRLPYESLEHDMEMNLMKEGGGQSDLPLDTPGINPGDGRTEWGPISKRLRSEKQQEFIWKHRQVR